MPVCYRLRSSAAAPRLPVCDERLLDFYGDGSFVFIPSGTFLGTATFTYEFYNDYGYSINPATVTINVQNADPVAQNDNYTILHDTVLRANDLESYPGVLANDSDADNDPLTARRVGPPPVSGTLSFSSNGTFTYTPVAGFVGTVTFSYVAHDGIADSNTSLVTIVVVNNAPVAQNDTYELPPGATVTESAPGVLGNDYDPDGDPITAVFEMGSGPLYGTLSFNANGSFVYTPDDPKFVGTDRFSYKAYDGIAYSNIALVTLNFNGQERVQFINNTRGGDQVVSALLSPAGIPGGIKTLDVQVVPANAVAILTIVRTGGTSGSAVFQDTQTATKQLTGGAGGKYTITIAGRDFSSQARNMRIEARIGGVLRGSWVFTVFMIDEVLARTTGNVNDDAVLPASVNSGVLRLRDIINSGTKPPPTRCTRASARRRRSRTGMGRNRNQGEDHPHGD